MLLMESRILVVPSALQFAMQAPERGAAAAISKKPIRGHLGPKLLLWWILQRILSQEGKHSCKMLAGRSLRALRSQASSIGALTSHDGLLDLHCAQAPKVLGLLQVVGVIA